MTYDDLIAVSVEVVPYLHVEAPCWWTWERMHEKTRLLWSRRETKNPPG